VFLKKVLADSRALLTLGAELGTEQGITRQRVLQIEVKGPEEASH